MGMVAVTDDTVKLIALLLVLFFLYKLSERDP
jgi:hypothetical protein